MEENIRSAVPEGGAEPDYKEMYLELFRATEKAINLLIAAQRKCEEMYIEGGK